MVFSERQSESVRFVRIKDGFQVLDQLVILSKSMEREGCLHLGLFILSWHSTMFIFKYTPSLLLV